MSVTVIVIKRSSSMKHAHSLLLVMLISCMSLHASDPQRGYRGFVDINTDFSFKNEGYGESNTEVYYSLSTTHGFQFSPHFFLGAGVAWERISDRAGLRNSEIPLFVQGRTDWTFGRVPLYGDLRIGGVMFGDYRFYLSPTVGYRLALGQRINLNVGIGMTFRGLGWSDEKTLHPQLALRVGIDF